MGKDSGITGLQEGAPLSGDGGCGGQIVEALWAANVAADRGPLSIELADPVVFIAARASSSAGQGRESPVPAVRWPPFEQVSRRQHAGAAREAPEEDRLVSEQYPAGIDVQILGRSIPTQNGNPALLIRVNYAPGAHLQPHTDPGTGVWSVERGAIGFAVQKGEAVITRAGATSDSRMAAGDEVVLNVGDTASYGPDNVHTSRNAGDTPATILIAGVYADEGSLVRPAAS